MNKKIEKALKEGKLIDYDEIFASYSKQKQKRILKGTKYLKTAMEIRKLRRKLKLTQNGLAKKMKVKRELVLQIESGRQNVTLETLCKIAEATEKHFTFQFK